jgi:NAD+ kinase
MKIKLIGKNLDEIRCLLPEFGLEESEREFELIICHGGDGALLGAERDFPGVLKFPVRDAGTAPTCAGHTLRERLEEFAAGKLKKTFLPKLNGICGGKRISGINDIFIHNKICCGALRYRVSIDGELYASEILGDGVGLSTVHGSTAYYRSITRSIFRTGIGLAFSNSTVEISHLVLPEHSHVEIEILRGPGLLIADNSPVTEIAEGEKAELFLSEEKAAICGLEEFMCPECRRIRHRRGNC